MLLIPDCAIGDALVDQPSPTRMACLMAHIYLWKKWHNLRALLLCLCNETLPTDHTLGDSVLVGFRAYGETRPLPDQSKHLAHQKVYTWIHLLVDPQRGYAWMPLYISLYSCCRVLSVPIRTFWLPPVAQRERWLS